VKKTGPRRRKSPIPPKQSRIYQHEAEADIPIWKEALFGAELLLLHASPVYYGLGIPHGDGSAVVVIPGFLGTDLYVTHIHSWLERIGYRAYLSGIGLNAECPNLLIRYRLAETIQQAVAETGRKIHLIGHSLGGIIARSVATQRPKDIASVITLAAPIRGTVMHPSILRAANAVRSQILDQHGRGVLPDCYTPRCTCDFLSSLRCAIPSSIAETAIYTKDDGIVDWRYCRTGNEDVDFEVPGTHVGLVFNPSVYTIIAQRLAGAISPT
jgi:triacylglycerol lipase